jgi:crotonobetainyl-CoA:carnitine CoA-transferase CaiB-like acyl-CoA transferase
MQGEAGFLGLSGEPSGPPARMGLSIVDYSTGTMCALALLAGILEARRTGRGRDLDVSLFDVAMHLLNYPAAWYLNNGLVTERVARSAHPFIAPSQLYRTKDGWIFVMAQTQGFWEKLADALGRSDLKARYPDFAARREHRDELTRILDAEFSTQGTEAWLGQLRGTIPCGPVYDLPRALENPYFLERGGVQVFDHPDKPGLKLVASPFRIGEPLPAKPAPKLGEHTDPLLAELGYSESDIAALRAAKAAG